MHVETHHVDVVALFWDSDSDLASRSVIAAGHRFAEADSKRGALLNHVCNLLAHGGSTTRHLEPQGASTLDVPPPIPT